MTYFQVFFKACQKYNRPRLISISWQKVSLNKYKTIEWPLNRRRHGAIQVGQIVSNFSWDCLSEKIGNDQRLT